MPEAGCRRNVGRAAKPVCRARPPAAEALSSRQRAIQFGGALARLAKIPTGALRMREEVARLNAGPPRPVLRDGLRDVELVGKAWVCGGLAVDPGIGDNHVDGVKATDEDGSGAAELRRVDE